MMMAIYKKYLRLNIDGSTIGLEQGESQDNYFCTPKGAGIIGWAGVDGIHFCFVRGFGEMVFAVSPMNTPGNYVYPLAENFKDFLRLLLACGHTTALEQAWCWDQTQFDEFLRENAPTAGQAAALAIIRERLSLSPIERPFAYIKELQSRFDYRRIKYTEDYDDFILAEPQIPEWQVYFDGSFRGRHGRERAGKEISLNRQFIWGNEAWSIPAIYICSKGLLVDFCLQVSPERMQFGTENPLNININPKALLNGIELLSRHGCGLYWNPCSPEGNSPEAKSAVQHYGLDPHQGYAIWRSAFPWKTKRKPQIKTLSLTLIQEPVPIAGLPFRVSLPGEQIELEHPSTGEKYTLTVQEYEQQKFSAKHFNDPSQEFPEHYTMMSYTISPDPPAGYFAVSDCIPPDRPRQKHTQPNAPGVTNSACCIGIIGYADGPTAIIPNSGTKTKVRTACSALHFEPVESRWNGVSYSMKKSARTWRWS